MFKHLTIALLCLLLVAACGGSGDDAPAVPNAQPLLLNAGTDISAAEGETVSVSGVASGGNGSYSFVWRGPEGVVIEQADQSSADALITAPAVTQSTSFTLTLQATDSDGLTASRSIALTVNPINILPVAIIVANSLENYLSRSYPVLAQIELDASSSFDQDPQTADADIAAYLWQQVAGENVLGSAALDTPILRFIAPVTLNSADIDIMLTVTDQEGAQATERITLTLLGQQGTFPELSLGKAVAVFSGEQMPLTSSVTSAAPNARPFNVTWQHNYVGELTIDAPNQNNTVAIAPLVEQTTEITFELNARDAFNNQVVSTVSYIVYPPQRSPINDTGVSLSGSLNGFQAAYVNDFPAQDAQFGSDRIAETGLLNKTGRGENGFDFTRLNENGDPVDDIMRPWRCVRDNVTGLIWETKNTIEDDIHNADQRFTWYQQEDNGNFEGEINAASQSCNLTNQQCNTESFVETVNQVGLCGFFDWRVPTHAELQSIVHYGKSVSLMLDSEYFPFAATVPQAPIWYWTNQSSADGVSDESARNAWAIDFASGVDNFLNKTSEQRVRLVRAGRSNP
ncbi:DUF1566 domain-containing protein [Glaciecola sp. SC05]|uniref:Lcl C-terminal domain-containing protein n=1 Tax=Glaciecola sp. SC05 TaxID=1987355 RepID=UPI003527E53B